jgi:hypothetical protein
MAGGIGAQKRIKIGDGKQTDITIRRAAGQKLPSRAFAKRKDLFRRKITKSQAPRSFAERSCHAGGRTSGSASATACLITRVGIRHGLLPRAAAIARAIPGIGIGQARATPRTAAIARAIPGIGIGQARATPRAAAIARAIARVGIGQSRAPPRAAPVAGAITGVGIREARAARASAPTTGSIGGISISDDGNDRGFLQRFRRGTRRRAQKRGGSHQVQDQ